LDLSGEDDKNPQNQQKRNSKANALQEPNELATVNEDSVSLDSSEESYGWNKIKAKK